MKNQGLTELHRHLDISLRLSTLLELAQDRGLVPLSTSLENFRQQIVLSQPLKNLREVIERFSIFQKVMSDVDSIERICFEAIEDCYYDGIRAVELRFSLEFMCGQTGVPWEQALSALKSGQQRAMDLYPEIKSGFIIIATREFGFDSVGKTLDFYLTNQHDFIGVDLAGNEDEFPCRLFTDLFKPLRSRSTPITIHAGEASGPQNIWEAIELLGARRIGHGIAAIQDPRLMTYLKEKQICLENCPTSNWITQAVSSWEKHPLPKFLRAGVPVTINTDDPTVFGIQLSQEIEHCRERLNLKESQIERCQAYAEKHSFLNIRN